MLWIYDIESYSNFFCTTFKNPRTAEVKVFVIYKERNDLDELHQFITDGEKWLIGYNSYNFDNQVLNYISKNHFELTMSNAETITNNIHNLVVRIIKDDFNDYRYPLPFQSLDLMKIGFYRKSLKLIGVSLKWPKLQELPIPMDQEISVDQIDTILDYNMNDVLITEQLFYHLEDCIKLRFDIAERYNVNVYSESDSGIANRLLEKFHSEATGLPFRSFKHLKTNRKFIPFTQVVFDEIHFQTNTLDTLLEEVKDFIWYKDIPFFKKRIVFDGNSYKMGIGGLHSEDEGGLFKESDKEYIIDADIGSMYPATMINHEIAPEHLGNKFLKNYTNLRNERLKAKEIGDMTPAESLKIVLNSAIGKTLNEHHWLYDPIVNLKITVNGQLYLLMLIERLSLVNLKTISANTDGITVIVPKDKYSTYKKVCEQWERDTKYQLEYTYYKLYARRDVNNYIAIKQDDSIKTKGIFIKDKPKKFSNMTDPLSKGFDKPIVSIALYEFFVNNIPIAETIKNHKDIYDFCIAKKIDDKFTNEYHYIKKGKHTIETLQKSVRYYVSITGGSLFKVNAETKAPENYEANKSVTIFNDYIHYNNIADYNIDYSYYIHQAQKVIDEIIKLQLTLF